jgi:hypothetical protein
MTEEELQQIEREMENYDYVSANYAGDKLRALIAEVRRLRKEIDDWECSEDRENGHLNSAQPFWSPPT